MVQRAVRLFRRWDTALRRPRDARGLDPRRRAHDPERLADHLKACSCVMCSQQKRRIAGPTWRERRSDDGT
jgi:hypothetical protein